MDGQSGTRSALGELQLNAGADDGISDDGAGAFAPPSAAQLMERSAATQEGVAALLSFGGADAIAAVARAIGRPRIKKQLTLLKVLKELELSV